MDRWAGRVAIVTGASSGIGAVIAVVLAKAGMRVVAVARRLEKLQELTNSVKTKGGKIYPMKADITKDAEVTALFTWVRQNLHGVDVLVNNAATTLKNSLLDGPFEAWKQILDLNVLALINCTSQAIKCMRDRGVDDGHIININSIFGHILVPYNIPIHLYNASKHAVTVLNEGFRKELNTISSNIRMTSISPGLVMTELFEHYMNKDEKDILYKENKSLVPEDVASAIVYALSAPPQVQIYEVTVKAVGEIP